MGVNGVQPADHRRRLVAWALFLGVALGAATVVAPAFRMGEAARQDRFDAEILAAAGESGCDPDLVKAVVWRESNFDPAVRGRAGELGLMQIRPVVGAEWAAATGNDPLKPGQLADPSLNLRVGAWYLAKAIRHWAHAASPSPLALAQYNAGRANVLKWVDANALADPDAFLSRIQFPSTRAYVQTILGQTEKYRRRGEF